MAGSIPINVVVSALEDDYFEDPAHLQEIERLQDFLGTLDGVDKTESYADYLKLVNYATNQYQREFYVLPEEAFEVRMLTNDLKMVLGEVISSRFVNPELSRANILLRTHISSTRDCLNVQKRIYDYVNTDFPKTLRVEVTGFGVVMAHSASLLTKGQLQSLSITLVLVFGIMFFLFFSLKTGLIAMVPNLFPIIMNFGLMGWLGMELSAATSLIAAIAIGLAVDDTIHYMFRCNRELRHGRDRERALENTIGHVGRPILFTTITISLGFAVLLFSSFEPTSAFGLMMVITMFSALVGDLLLLPALMLHARLVTVWDMMRIYPDELFTP
jgi:predicted RND superfamily exporter protein